MTLSKNVRHPIVRWFLLGLASLLERLNQKRPLPGRLPGRIAQAVKYLRYIAGGSTVIDPPPKTGGLVRRLRRWVQGPGHPSTSRKLATQ